MPAGDVTLTVSADAMNAIRELQALAAAADKIALGLGKAAGQSRNTGGSLRLEIGSASQAAGAFVQKLTGVGSATAAVAGVATLLKNEYQELVRIQSEAAGTHRGVAKARENAIQNAGPLGQFVDEQAARLAREEGGKLEHIYPALGSALSARGSMSPEATVEALRTAMRFSPNSPENWKGIAGSVLDWQKLGGGSAEQNAGQMLYAQQAARIESAQAFAAHGVPAIAQIQAFGGSREQAAEIYATLTQGMVDREGSMAHSAAVQIMKRFESDLKGVEGVEQTPAGWINFLQSDDKRAAALRREYFEGGAKGDKKLEMEGKAFTTVRGLLAPGETAEKKLYAEARGAMPGEAQGAVAFEEFRRQLRAAPVERTAELARAGEQRVEGLQVANPQAIAGQVRGDLESYLAAQGTNWVDRFGAARRLDVETRLGAAETGRGESAEAAARVLRSGAAYAERYGAADVAADRRKRADEFDAFAKELRSLRDELAKNREATAENTRATAEAAPDGISRRRTRVRASQGLDARAG